MSLDDRRLPVAALAVVGLAYVLTSTRVLTHTDSPEFVGLMMEGGFAHPPGYPTVVLFYRAFSWIPVDPPALAGLLTALVGLGTVVLLYFACRAWGAGRFTATAATVLVGLNAQVWLIHTHPEAFAFNDLFAAAILLMAAPNPPLRGTGRVAVLGALAGLGLGAHHTLVLVAPIGLYGVYLGARESRSVFLSLAVGALCLAAGLSVYGYLLVADSALSFGRIDDIDDLLHHFLRREYGTTRLGASGESDPMTQFVFWASESLVASLLVGFLLTLVGLRSAIANGKPRSAWLALAAAWLMCGPVFVLVFNQDPVGPTAEVVRRFHVLSVIVSTPFVALGVQWLRDAEIDRRLKLVGTVAVVGLLLVAGVNRTERVYSATIEDHLRNTLVYLPEGAVFVGQGDHRYFGSQYLQHVEGLRRDVVVVEPTALGYEWYVDRLRDRLGVEIPYPEYLGEDDGKKVDLRTFFRIVHEETDRELYVTRDFAPHVLREYRMVPEGTGWRLLREGESAPSPDELVEKNLQIYEAFQHRDAPPYSGDNAWGWSLYNAYTRVWLDLVDRCVQARDECADPAREMLEKFPDL